LALSPSSTLPSLVRLGERQAIKRGKRVKQAKAMAKVGLYLFG